MSYGAGKLSNEYARTVRDIDASKTVWAALAFSFAMRLCGDDQTAAHRMVLDEWAILHANGIVPQKPRVSR